MALHDWALARERVDTAQRQKLGLPPGMPLTSAQRFGRPGLLIKPADEKEAGLEILQRRYEKGDRSEELYQAMLMARP